MEKSKVVEQFGLPSDEEVFDEFSCSLKKTVLRTGQLWVTTRCLCFFSKKYGLRVKELIPFSEIEGIEKKKDEILIKWLGHSVRHFHFKNDLDDAMQKINHRWEEVKSKPELKNTPIGRTTETETETETDTDHYPSEIESRSTSFGIQTEKHRVKDDVNGDLHLKINYVSPTETENGTATIQVIEAKNLASRDANGFSDPFVVVRLGKKEQRTKTIKKNLNPAWNESFNFNIKEKSNKNKRYVEVTVWDWDMVGMNDFMGQIIIDLWNLPDGMVDAWYPLKTQHEDTETTKSELQSVPTDQAPLKIYSDKSDITGELHLQMKYKPPQSEEEDGLILVKVLGARDLALNDENGTIDPYLVLKIDKKERTISAKEKSSNPVFEEEFEVPIRFTLKNPELQIMAWDKNKVSPNDFLGAVVIDISSLEKDKLVDEWYTLLSKQEAMETQKKRKERAQKKLEQSPHSMEDDEEEIPKSKVIPLRGLTCRQSSTFEDNEEQYCAANVVDNLLNISHTKAEFQPWWEVDLGRLYEIDSVTIINRRDAFQERLKEFWLLISAEPFDSPHLEKASDKAVWKKYQTKHALRSKFVVPKVIGRYVRIQLEGSDFLHMAKLEMTGTPYIPPEEPEQLPEEILKINSAEGRISAKLEQTFCEQEDLVTYLFAVFTWKRPVDFLLFMGIFLCIFGWMLWMNFTVLTSLLLMSCGFLWMWWLSDLVFLSVPITEKLNGVQPKDAFDFIAWTVITSQQFLEKPGNKILLAVGFAIVGTLAQFVLPEFVWWIVGALFVFCFPGLLQIYHLKIRKKTGTSSSL